MFASRRVRSTTDLKGTTVAISKLRSHEHLFISMVAVYVGLHPERETLIGLYGLMLKISGS